MHDARVIQLTHNTLLAPLIVEIKYNIIVINIILHWIYYIMCYDKPY